MPHIKDLLGPAYISGPMTDYVDHNFPAFFEAERRLLEHFALVVNPARLNGHEVDWHTCMRNDIKALCDCQILVLLPGWEHSQGAHLELQVAHRLGLLIVTYKDLLEQLACPNSGHVSAANLSSDD